MPSGLLKRQRNRPRFIYRTLDIKSSSRSAFLCAARAVCMCVCFSRGRKEEGRDIARLLIRIRLCYEVGGGRIMQDHISCRIGI